MKVNQVCAVVTTFNPEASFPKTLEILLAQVGMIVVVDDSGCSHSKVDENSFIGCKNICYIKNKRNVGIAASLNKGIEYAKSIGFDFIITLDDDSTLGDNYVSTLFEFLTGNKNALLAIGVNDNLIVNSRPIVKRAVITSGSLFSYNTFKSVGGFKEELFIDYVDFDFCLRLRLKNIGEIYSVPDALFEHQIGESSNIGKKFFYFNSYNHSSFRIYYQTRNAIYMLRKYFYNYPLYSMYIGRNVLILPLKVLLLDTNKLPKISYYFKGLMDGVLGRWGRI